MIGILLIAHTPVASAFLTVVHHVFKGEPFKGEPFKGEPFKGEPFKGELFKGEPAYLEAIDVQPDQNTDEVIKLARQAIKRLNSGTGVLVLTDISGATPGNCSQQLNMPGQVAVLAGLSLPMLLRALTYRTGKLESVIEMAQSGALNGAVRLGPDLSDLSG